MLIKIGAKDDELCNEEMTDAQNPPENLFTNEKVVKTKLQNGKA